VKVGELRMGKVIAMIATILLSATGLAQERIQRGCPAHESMT
jgi:hypothetical protein